MADIDEQEFDGITVQIDRTLCVGFGDCVTAEPGVFEIDGSDVAVFRMPAESVPRERLLAACAACPVDAIVVLDSSGARLVP